MTLTCPLPCLQFLCVNILFAPVVASQTNGLYFIYNFSTFGGNGEVDNFFKMVIIQDSFFSGKRETVNYSSMWKHKMFTLSKCTQVYSCVQFGGKSIWVRSLAKPLLLWCDFKTKIFRMLVVLCNWIEKKKEVKFLFQDQKCSFFIGIKQIKECHSNKWKCKTYFNILCFI